MQTERLLTYADLAGRWTMKIGTLYSLVSRGELPCVRLGKRLVRFVPEIIDRYIEERSIATLSTQARSEHVVDGGRHVVPYATLWACRGARRGTKVAINKLLEGFAEPDVFLDQHHHPTFCMAVFARNERVSGLVRGVTGILLEGDDASGLTVDRAEDAFGDVAGCAYSSPAKEGAVIVVLPLRYLIGAAGYDALHRWAIDRLAKVGAAITSKKHDAARCAFVPGIRADVPHRHRVFDGAPVDPYAIAPSLTKSIDKVVPQ